ncbi:MAG: protein kinase, partial [Thermoanaerobaculia bacterium]
VQRRIARGGMGEVYEAWDDTLSRRVAIKVLPPLLLDQPERVRRFIQEARSASALNHPHIVTIYEFGQDDVGGRTIPFIAMEFVDGTSLHHLIASGRSTPRRFVTLLTQVADALAKAHACGIVHRDLKPANIMVTPDGYAKIVDFGLAKLIEPADPAPSSGSPTISLSRGIGLVGTVGYAAPEQIGQRESDHRADIFSFGCILYEALTRRRAFTADSHVEILHATLHDTPPPVTSIDPSITPALRRITERCLEKQPEDRYESMKDIAADLRDAEMEMSSGGSAGRLTAPLLSGRLRPRRRLTLALAVAAVLVLAAFSAHRFMQPASLPTLKALITWPTDEYDCSISPDQQWVSFVSTRSGRPAIYLRRMAGGEPTLLVDSPSGINSHAWSPAGDRIAYLSVTDGTPYLQMVPAFGGAASDSTKLAGTFRNGRIVRWLSNGLYLESDGLWRLELPSRKVSLLVPAAARDGRRSSFDVRKDGRKLAFTLSRGELSSVWLARIDGHDATRLTAADAKYRDFAPQFRGPRDQQLVFSSNRTGQVDLWRISLLTRRAQQITFSPAEEMLEDISPDGRLMVYLETRDQSQLWIVDERTGDQRRVAAEALDSRWPSVAAGRIAFQRRKSSMGSGPPILDGEIVVAALGPEGLDRPSVAVADAALPELSPDGNWLAFVKTQANRYELWAKDLRTSHHWRVTDRFKLPGLYIFPSAWTDSSSAWDPSSSEIFVVTKHGRREGLLAARLRDGATRQIVPEVERASLSDVHVSKDGRLVSYVRVPPVSPPRAEVVVHDLASGSDTVVYSRATDWRQRVYSRGWTRANELLVLLARVNVDWTEDLDVVFVSPSGAHRTAKLASSAFGGSSVLDRARDSLLMTTVGPDGVHNVDAIPLSGGTRQRITNNRVSGTSFAALEILGGQKVLLSKQERNDDLWLIEFAR